MLFYIYLDDTITAASKFKLIWKRIHHGIQVGTPSSFFRGKVSHSRSKADTKNTRNCSQFFSRWKEKNKNYQKNPKPEKQTNKNHKHPPPSTILLPQTNKTPPKDPPNPKPEEISCKIMLNKSAGLYETRSHHLVFIFVLVNSAWDFFW